MIKSSFQSALNKQIAHEQSNAHAYDAVSLYFNRVHLPGLGAFMRQQMREERRHARKFIRHVADRGGQVELGALPAPRSNFATPLEAARSVRDLERTTSEMIHRLHETARKEGDSALEVLLQWFITEQVEEEKWANELADLVEKFHERAGQMLILDHDWGKRVNHGKNKTKAKGPSCEGN
jgi:ferritin